MQKPQLTDFFDVKGNIETLLDLLEKESILFQAPGPSYLHPGRSATISVNEHLVGEIGQLHPEVAADRKFKQEVWLSYFDLDRLLEVPLRRPRYERLSRYPAVERDLSLVLDNETSYERLRSAIVAIRIPELRSVEAHELFRGSGVPEGKYSLLLRLQFQSSERTLRDEEVAAWSAQVIVAVDALGGSLRA